MSALKYKLAKVDVLRDSHKLLVTPYREFGGKTVLAGLRLKKQLMVVSKTHLKFEVCFDVFTSRQADPTIAPSVSDRGAHSTCHFGKFSVCMVQCQKSCGNLKLRLLLAPGILKTAKMRSCIGQ
jgi:hypothetical protein